jgi:methionyl aminopeptidase
MAASVCATPDCNKLASLTCPTCIKYQSSSPSKFCGQDCFKGYWKVHNEVHKQLKDIAEYKPFQFDYTGAIRPAYVSTTRSVPSHISKPDYSLSGEPLSEYKMRGKTTIHINTEKEIKCIRAASKIGREALDLAHSLISPGITTDYIDEKVHEFIISKNAYPSPLNYRFFPKSICTSVNEVICHGIPDYRKLEEGDIVNVDISVYYQGQHN